MAKPKTYRTKDVAAGVIAAGYPCSESTARRLVPDLRASTGGKYRTYNEQELKLAVAVVIERLRKPSERRLRREARAQLLQLGTGKQSARRGGDRATGRTS